MNLRSGHSQKAALEQQARSLACAFAASLHGKKDAQTAEALRVWLEESPIHRKAWEQVSDILETSHGLRPELLKRILNRLLATRPSRSRFRRRPTIVAAAACGLILVGFGILKLGLLNQTPYSTQIGEQRTVLLSDGTRMTLDTATRVSVAYDRHTRRVILESGAAFFDVAHESRPFSVSAGERKVIALGTSFTVRHDAQSEKNLTVTLIEGRVAVAKPEEPDTLSPRSTGGKTVLISGQRLQMHGNAPPAIDYPSIEQETSWMRGQIYFKNTRLIDAVAELNRYNSTVRLAVAPSVSQCQIGGIFRAGDSESFARGVVATCNLRAARNGRTLTLEPYK